MKAPLALLGLLVICSSSLSGDPFLRKPPGKPGADPFGSLVATDPFTIKPAVHFGGNPNDRLGAIWDGIMNAPPVKPDKPISAEVEAVPHHTYEAARAAAIADHRPMAVGIGCSPPTGYWFSVQVASLPGFTGPAVVVALPEKGELYPARILPATASAQDIAKSVLGGIPGLTAAGSCNCGPDCPCAPCSGGGCFSSATAAQGYFLSGGCSGGSCGTGGCASCGSGGRGRRR
jgi:hypothetical protein